MNDINILSYQELLNSIYEENVDIRNSITITCSSLSAAEEWLGTFSCKIDGDLLPYVKAALNSNRIYIEYSANEVDLLSLLDDCSVQTRSDGQLESGIADIVKVGLYSQRKFRGKPNHQRNLDYKCGANERSAILERILVYFTSLGLSPSNSNLIEYRQSGRLSFPILRSRESLFEGSGKVHNVVFSNIESARRAIGFRALDVENDPESILINQKYQVNALELAFMFSGSALRVHLSFVSEFFSDDDVDRFINEIDNIVALRAPLVGAGAQKAIDPIENGSFLKKIYDNAASNFDKTIIRYGDRQFSWRDVVIRSACIAKGLKAFNLQSSYCGVMLEPSADFVCAVVGIMMAGKTYVPISAKFGRDRLLDILSGSEVKHVITNNSAFLNDEEIGRHMISVSDFYSASIAWSEALGSFNFNCTNEVLYRLHTSGSTGTPKAVDVTYANYIALVESYDDFLDDFRSLNWAFTGSPVFDSSTKQYLFPLLNNTLIFLPTVSVDEDVGRCCEEMVAGQVDVLNMTPALIKLAMDSGTDISTFKYVLTGGEALSAELYQEILEKTGKNNLLNMYGPTEATVNSTGHVGSADILFYESLPIGKGLKHSRTCVVNKELEAQPMGCRGELLISGALVTNGYPNDEARTLEKFISLNGDVWYKTGDQVVHWFDDNLYFIGRNDNQIKINGVRIELGEISSRLSKMSSIRLVDVLYRNNRIYAFFLGKDGEEVPSEFDLQSEARSILPHYIVVGKFIRVDKVPLTVQGKTDRQALIRVLDELNEAMSANQTANITDAADLAIYTVISSVLITKGIPCYEIDKRLVDQGVDSLTSLEISVQLEKRLGLTAQAKSIVHSESLKEIRTVLQSKSQNVTSGWNQVRDNGVVIVLFPPVLGDPAIFRELEGYLSAVNTAFIHCTYPGLARSTDRPGSISELAGLIGKEVEQSSRENNQIIFLAYSMGCLVATEVAQYLLGKRAIDNIILLDKGPYNSVIHNTLPLQQKDSLRFLRESIKEDSLVDNEVLSQLEEYVKHNTRISFYHEPKKIRVETNALCIKCTSGGESFYNEDWQPYFSDFSIKQLDCDHGQLVRGTWAEKVSNIIVSHLSELAV